MSDSNSMSAHCINIAISGISSKASDELKIELRQIIPNHFDINWVNISNKNIDLLLIHAKFFDTQGIQQLIKERKFLFLKISNEYREQQQTMSMNLGIDWSLFKNKVSGSFEYYTKRGKDLITSLDVPSEYGVTSMYVNGGTMKNSGYEVSANFVPVRTRTFTWSVNLNTSKNINEITKTGPQVVNWQTATMGQLNVVGKPVSAFYAFKTTGINPANGEPIIDLSVAPGANVKDPTSFMQYMGKLDPDFTSGLGMNFRYKMLTLSSSFYLQVGGSRFLAPLYNYASSNSGLPTEYENLSRLILDRWTPANPNATVPALPNGTLPNVALPNGDSRGGNNLYTFYNYSTDRVVSATSLRCNNVNVSYTLPETVVKKLKCKNVAVGGGVSNPFSINSADFRGIDPEVAFGGQPRTRTYTLNLNLSF